jgi:hypothetical protein
MMYPDVVRCQTRLLGMKKAVCSGALVKTIVCVLSLWILLCSCYLDFSFSAPKSPGAAGQPEQEYSCNVVWQSIPFEQLSYLPWKVVGSDYYAISTHDLKSGKRVVLKFDLDTGNVVWESSADLLYLGHIEVIEDTVYTINQQGVMYCLDAATGSLVATVKFDQDETLAERKTVWLGDTTSWKNVLVWGGSGLFRFDTAWIDRKKPPAEVQIISPECLYAVPVGTGVAATPAIDGDVAYCMRTAIHDELGENTIAAYNLATNTLVWERHSNKSTGLVCDGMIVVGDWLYIIDAYGSACFNKYTGGKDASTATGERWVNNCDSGNPYWMFLSADSYGQGLWISNGKMYFTNSAHSNTWKYLGVPEDKAKNIICLSLENGSLVWGDMPSNSPSLGTRPIVANGKAYVNAYKSVRVYDAETGRLLGVDKTITPLYRFSRNDYYAAKGYIIIFSNKDNTDNGRLVAVKAE